MELIKKQERKVGIVLGFIGLAYVIQICVWAFHFNSIWPPEKGGPDFRWAMWLGPIGVVFFVVCLALLIFQKNKDTKEETEID